MNTSLRSWLGVAAGAAAVLGVVGCSLITGSGIGKGLGESCESDDDCQASACVENVCTLACAAAEDCPTGSTCIAETCQSGCATAEDCPDGQVCLPDGTCEGGSLPVGAACMTNDECSTGLCDDGLCTKQCSTDADCPDPSECLGDLCQIPLEVGFIWVGVVEDQGWTRTHDDGRQYALDTLPYLKADYVTNIFLPDTAQAAVDDFAADGKKVIVANSFSLRNPISDAADSHPDQDFLVCSGNVTKPNLGSYFARSYQSWYLAGYAAAAKSTTDRLGFVGSFVTPELIRHIDAFTLGARRLKPNIKVEVRWEGFWFDLDDAVGGKYRETVLAEELLETGCDVITHNSDNGRVVEAVEEAHDGGMDVWSIGNDNIDACKLGPSSCIGVPYWNWGPMYVAIFDQMHRGTWDPSSIVNDNIKVNPEESITNFGIVTEHLSSDLEINLGELRSNLASDPNLVFRGPYDIISDQRPEGDHIDDGEEISDEELGTMCWYVEGVIEKEDPTDPLSADVPARVPWGDVNVAGPGEIANQPDCRVNQ